MSVFVDHKNAGASESLTAFTYWFVEEIYAIKQMPSCSR